MESPGSASEGVRSELSASQRMRRLRKLQFHALIDAEAVRRGGGCESCGDEYVPGEFHWHHRDRDTKSFNISAAGRRRTEALLLELAKCDLLCPPCHRRKHRRREVAA